MKQFWVIKWGELDSGHDSDISHRMGIYWGTFMEAARELIRLDDSMYHEKKIFRKITPMVLPDTRRKKKGFMVFK